MRDDGGPNAEEGAGDPHEHLPEERRPEPRQWGLVAMSIMVLVGLIVLLVGAGSLVAVAFFPDQAFAGGPLQDQPRSVQALASLLVFAVGALMAGVPIARSVREMWEVRKRETEER